MSNLVRQHLALRCNQLLGSLVTTTALACGGAAASPPDGAERANAAPVSDSQGAPASAVASPSATSTAAAHACPDGMAFVPAGSFAMGKAGTVVVVEAFCLDTTEVTSASYAACGARGACPSTPAKTEFFLGKDQGGTCNLDAPGREAHPMNCVDWEQATAYCSAEGKRLPTSAEWEWAARGGDEARAFAWGSEFATRGICWNAIDEDAPLELLEKQLAKNHTCRVGTAPRDVGRFGHSDLTGNVAEWTSSVGPNHPLSRVTRGNGPKLGSEATFRTTHTENLALSDRLNSLGFRCAR